MLRCHTSSPEGKGQNLISYNLVSEMYILACLLANQNLHRLLDTGHLPTTALPKRFSLILLWGKLSQRAPIPIVNPLQYTVRIYWREKGCTLLFVFTAALHNWFQNRNSLLVLTCWLRDDKLEVFWKHKLLVKLHLKSVLEEYMMSVDNLKFINIY